MFFYKTLLPLCLRRADRCLTVSMDSKNDISRLLHVDPQRIDVLYNAIDTESFKPSARPAKKKHLLFVGTLQPRKNHINVLKGFCLSAHTHSYPLIVIGASGWKNSELGVYVKSIPMHLRKRIFFKGYVKRQEVKSFYRSAIALLCPSLHEGFGLCIAESMAAGSAVITSRRGAIPEIFKNAPYYVDPESPEDIAKAIGVLITDTALRASLEKRGSALIKKYDITHLGKIYKDYFERIMKEKAPRAEKFLTVTRQHR